MLINTALSSCGIGLCIINYSEDIVEFMDRIPDSKNMGLFLEYKSLFHSPLYINLHISRSYSRIKRITWSCSSEQRGRLGIMYGRVSLLDARTMALSPPAHIPRDGVTTCLVSLLNRLRAPGAASLCSRGAVPLQLSRSDRTITFYSLTFSPNETNFRIITDLSFAMIYKDKIFWISSSILQRKCREKQFPKFYMKGSQLEWYNGREWYYGSHCKGILQITESVCSEYVVENVILDIKCFPFLPRRVDAKCQYASIPNLSCEQS